MAVFAVWFALGVPATVYADATFDGCTLYSRVKVGNGTQTSCAPIDTGFIPCGTTSIDAKYREWKIDSSINSCLFCSRSSSSSGPHFTYFAHVGSKARWDYDTKQDWGTAHAPSLNPNYRLIVENGKATVYTTLDRTLSTMTGTASTFAGQYKMYLFASYDTGYASFNNSGQYYFYYLKAYDGPIANGKLQHHYVPCKTSEGKVGVADLVEEKVLLPSQNQALLVVDENDSLGQVRPMIDASAFSALATFTASGYEGSEELEEFPALVRLAENSPEGFSYDDCSADGSDIRFADAEGHLIAHEIDTWDPAGESLIWVNVPKLTAETQFRMYIGGDGSAPTLPSSSVWRRAGYHFVDHNNVISSTAGADSTGSGLVGVKYSGDLAVAAVEGAPMGKADDQTNSHGWTVVKDAKWSAHGGQVTISCWSYRTDVTTTTGRQLMGVKGAYYLKNNTPANNKLQLGYNSTDLINVEGPVAAGNWMQISGVMNGTTYKLYQNGVPLGTAEGTAIADAADKLSFGSEYVGASRNKGYLDEYRLRWGSSSEDWVKAEYDTVMKAGFLEGVMGAADVPVPEDWEYSFAITLSAGMKSALGSGEEVNFPVLVRLSEAGISGFKYSDFKEADYSDLIFVDKDGKFLDYEVDTWDASGTSLVWVRVPSLAAASTITCRYSGPKYKHKPEKTWAGYIGVWHMNEADGNAVDATGHGLNGVPTGFNTALMVSDTTAPTGRGRVNQTATGSGTGASNRLSVPNYNDFITDHSKFTLSGWFKSTDKTGYPRPLSRKNAYNDGTGWEVQYDNGSATSVSVRGSDGNAAVTLNGPDSTAGWFSLAFVFNGTSETSYGNGGETSQSGTVVAVKTRNDPMAIGNNSNGSERGWCGMYDEVRLYNGVMSAARVKADYLVIKDPGALVYATVVTPDPDMPKLANVALSVDESGNVVVSGDVLRHAGVVTVTLFAEGQAPVEIVLGEVAADDSFSRVCTEDDGLLKFQSYTASVSAANGAKVAVKQITEPVKYGKASLVDMNYRIDVTVPEGFTTVPLENFPLLVRLSTAIPGFDYSQFQNEGKDLMVFDEEGNRIPCELENWDPVGESRLWVQVPVVTNGAKVIVCYGLSGTVESLGGMWSEYASVLHMNDNVSGGSQVKDSTGNAVPVLNTQGASDLGVLGGGFTMGNVSGKNCACVTVPVSAKLDECNGVFTASAWTKLNAAPGWGYLMGRKDSDKTASWGLQFRGAGNTGNADGLALYTAGTADSQQSLFKTLTCFKTGDWVKWTAVYNGTDLALYLNGVEFAKQTTAYGAAVNGTLPLCIGGFPTATNTATLPAAFDEARVKVGAVGDEWVAAEYAQETGSLPLIYSEVGPTDPNAPVINEPVITPNDDGTFHVSVTITENMPLAGSVKLVYGSSVTEMTTDATEVPAVYGLDVTPPAADVTSVVTIRAKSQLGSTRSLISSGFYNGELKIEMIRNASEKGLSNGIWRVTRADTSYDLKVAFVILDTSTATAGVDYVEFVPAVTITNGAAAADVELTPIMNLDRDYDTWVDMAITNGAYRINPFMSAARVKIINYEIPSGGNIWCATAPGKASVASNWTSGTVPDELSSIMFDGDVSCADCEWDIDATHKLKNWTQMANYSGTVTIATTFDDSFPKFTVDGDMLVLGGVVRHKPHDSSHKVDVYRLALEVTGMLSVGKGASISARGLGSYGPRPEGQSCYGGGYDGSRSWGSLTEPNAVGSSANDNGTYTCFGGGAIWIEVGGTAAVNGSINANGIKEAGAWDTHAGSGGSLYLKCSRLTGSGTVSANCENTQRGSNSRSGAGGRVSVLLTGSEMTEFKYTQFDARAGWTSYAHHGGTGTVLVRSPAKPNGILYLRDAEKKYDQYGYRVSSLSGRLTDIPQDQDWTLDGIVFGDNAVLRIPTGTSLALPNGLESVTSDAADINCGIIVDGGILDLPVRTQIMSGKWTLTSRNQENVTRICGDLVMRSGANIGSIALHHTITDDGDAIPLYGKCKLRVEGDLTVEDGATLIARRCGLKKSNNSLNSGHKGILQGHTHGGRVFNYKSKDAQQRMYTAYDSVFAPSLPGNAVPWPNGQSAEESGGVISLDIAGRFQMEGKADVSGYLDTYTAGGNCSGGTGGSIDITAGSIAGRGSIKAEGGVKQAICGPGGRIAIKLTDEGADFSSFKGVISASGRVNGTDYANASSAGTVFLKTGDDSEKGGTIRIAMSSGNWNVNNPSSTELLSVGYGGDSPMDYKELGLEISDFGFGAVNANLDMSWAKFIGSDSRLDLEGHSLTVYRAWINGSKVPIGTYHAGDYPFENMLVDSYGGGHIRVTGYGLWVFVQ